MVAGAAIGGAICGGRSSDHDAFTSECDGAGESAERGAGGRREFRAFLPRSAGHTAEDTRAARIFNTAHAAERRSHDDAIIGGRKCRTERVARSDVTRNKPRFEGPAGISCALVDERRA